MSAPLPKIVLDIFAGRVICAEAEAFFGQGVLF